MLRWALAAILLLFLLACTGLDVAVPRPAPKCFLLLSNLQSGSNIGAICRNALAFNVAEVIVVGRPNFKEKMRMADRGSKALLKFTNYPSSQIAFDYVKRELGATVIGIEIMPTATSIVDYKFSDQGNVCFVFGNEGAGLSEVQRKNCDTFCYIPQYSGGMASINVACCAAIVLQTFAVRAGYQQSQMAADREKFL